MPVLMKCPRNYILRTRLGHVVSFIADEPTLVPDAAYAEALSKNIIPVERPDTEKPYFELAHADITGTLRDALIYRAIHETVLRNSPEDFQGGGVPKAKLISDQVGVTVSATEVGKYYQNYRQIIAENSDLPSHDKIDLVLELQSCSTRKQMEEFAEQIDMPLPATKSKSLKELKGALLYGLINSAAQASAADLMTAANADKSEYKKPSSLTMD